MKQILILTLTLVFSFQLIANPGKRLIEFIKQDNTKEVQNSLTFEDFADVNYKDKEGKTPLIYAVMKNNMPIVVFLVEKGAIINMQDNDGKASLHFSAMSGNKDIVVFLLENGANPLIQSERGELASQLVLGRDKIQIIKILEKAEKNKEERYVAYIAKILKDLKDKKIREKSKSGKEKKKVKKEKITEEYIRKKINVKFKSKALNEALVALMLVLYQKDIIQAKKIIEVFSPYSSFSLVLNYLLNYFSSYTSYIIGINFLLENGADINAGDSEGNTPLHNASKEINRFTVFFLLKKGAKANALNKFENAPIHLLANEYYNVTNNNVGYVIQIIEAIKENETNILKSGSFLYAPAYTIAMFNTEGNVVKGKLTRKNQKKIIKALSNK